ncbi:hypothetical protein GVX81_08790 [[Haemophilus] felis]|nr:hypothetical protein [[Haemophilus] felis]
MKLNYLLVKREVKMNKSELESMLTPLKKDLEERINFRGILQSIINKHFPLINDCMNKGISLSLIHSIIFPKNDVSYSHLRNLFYRAKNKLSKNPNHIFNNQEEERKEELQANNETQNNSVNVFSFLAKKEETPIHDNRSDPKAVDERVKQLLMRKKQKEALNENK